MTFIIYLTMLFDIDREREWEKESVTHLVYLIMLNKAYVCNSCLYPLV